MITIQYVYSDGFRIRFNLRELVGHSTRIIEILGRLHGGVVALEVPIENRIGERDVNQACAVVEHPLWRGI
jgi:hypothetical protein